MDLLMWAVLTLTVPDGLCLPPAQRWRSINRRVAAIYYNQNIPRNVL